MIRITHSKDCFFSRMNNIVAYKTREDGTEYESDKLWTADDEAALAFVQTLINNNMTIDDVKYELTHITDCE